MKEKFILMQGSANRERYSMVSGVIARLVSV